MVSLIRPVKVSLRQVVQQIQIHHGHLEDLLNRVAALESRETAILDPETYQPPRLVETPAPELEQADDSTPPRGDDPDPI